MSPARHRAESSHGPLIKGALWSGGTIASLALVFSLSANHALATALSGYEGASPHEAPASSPASFEERHRSDSAPNTEVHHRPHNRIDAGECTDIDAYRPSTEHEVKAVLNAGVTYVGIRDLTPTVTPFTWYDLTDTLGPNGVLTYPGNACSVAISARAGKVSVQVLTVEGKVWETPCTIVEGEPDTLACDEVWIEQNAPIPGAPHDH